MPITAPVVLEDGGSTTDQASYNTDAFAPTDGRLVMAFINSHEDGLAVEPNDPVLSGGGVTTWNLLDEQWWTTNEPTEGKITIWWAKEATYGAAAALNISFAGQDQAQCFWAIVEIPGADAVGATAKGLDNAATNFGAEQALASAPAGTSIILGMIGNTESAGVPVPTSPAVSLFTLGLTNSTNSVNVAWVDCDGVIDSIAWTWSTGARYGVVVAEVTAVPADTSGTGLKIWDGSVLIDNCRADVWDGATRIRVI